MILLLILLFDIRSFCYALNIANITAGNSSVAVANSNSGPLLAELNTANSSFTAGRIYSCSAADIVLYQGICNFILFETYREGTPGTCESQIPSMLNCSRGIIDICNRGVFNASLTDRTKQQYITTLTAATNIKMMCEDAGINRDPPQMLTQHCDGTFNATYKKCVKAFHGIFENSFGDPLLCQEYYTTSECISTAQSQHCQGGSALIAPGLLKHLKQQYGNPFCSLKQGGADPLIVVRGKIPPISSGTDVSYRSVSLLFVAANLFVISILVAY